MSLVRLKGDMVLHSGIIYAKHGQADEAFTLCDAALCGPVLQIFPKRLSNRLFGGGRRTSNADNGFEIDLGEYVEVRLETVPINPSER
jgi:hypothetical protein